MTLNDVLEHINVVASLLTNCTLLYLITKHSPQSLGTYKYLLIVFAALDLLLTALHFVIIPRAYNFDFTFSLYSERFTDNSAITPIYGAFFTTPYALMNINFLHRYWAVTSMPKLSLFTRKPFIAALSLYPLVHLFIWIYQGQQLIPDESGIVSAHFKAEFNRNITGFRYLRFWNGEERDAHSSAENVRALLIMGFNLTIAFSLASATLWHINKAKTFSPTYRSLQIKIFRALLAQTLLPIIFVYTPFTCVIMLPYLRLEDKLRMDQHAMTLTSFFPAWDAIVVILLMKDYRDGLRSLITRRATVKTATSVWKTNTTQGIKFGNTTISLASSLPRRD